MTHGRRSEEHEDKQCDRRLEGELQRLAVRAREHDETMAQHRDIERGEKPEQP
jgi:hypothetical protein